MRIRDLPLELFSAIIARVATGSPARMGRASLPTVVMFSVTFTPTLSRDRDAPVDPGSRPTGSTPNAFVMRGGMVVADDCEGGDVDAVMAGKAAVVFAQTRAHGHPFALLDAAAVEARSAREGCHCGCARRSGGCSPPRSTSAISRIRWFPRR